MRPVTFLHWQLPCLVSGIIGAVGFTYLTFDFWAGQKANYGWSSNAAAETNASDAPTQERPNSVYQSIYPNVQMVVFAIGWAALFYAFYIVITLLAREPSQAEKFVHLLAWTLGPPAFFFLEWFYLFPKYGVPSANAADAMKSGQAVASAFWAGFVAFIAAIHVAKQERATAPSHLLIHNNVKSSNHHIAMDHPIKPTEIMMNWARFGVNLSPGWELHSNADKTRSFPAEFSFGRGFRAPPTVSLSIKSLQSFQAVHLNVTKVTEKKVDFEIVAPAGATVHAIEVNFFAVS